MARTPKFHGMTRVDANAPLTLVLKESDVLNSMPGDMDHCVIANGLTRQRSIVSARVGACTAYVAFRNEPGIVRRYYLTAKDYGRVLNFDDMPDGLKAIAKWVDGMEITLIPPPPSHRLGYKQGKSGSNKRKGKAKSVHHRRSIRHISFNG